MVDSPVALDLYKRDEVVGVALIDATDEKSVHAAGRWHLAPDGYVYRAKKVPGRGSRNVLLHRFLLGLGFGDLLVVDHINLNRLDNRRSNLRVVTQAVNAHNRRSVPGTASRLRGVSWNTAKQKWVAQVQMAGVNHYLGGFDSEVDASEVARSFRLEHMAGTVET